MVHLNVPIGDNLVTDMVPVIHNLAVYTVVSSPELRLYKLNPSPCCDAPLQRELGNREVSLYCENCGVEVLRVYES